MEIKEPVDIRDAIKYKELELALRKVHLIPKIVIGTVICIFLFCATISFMYWKLIDSIQESETTTTTTFHANAENNSNSNISEITIRD